MGAVLEVRDLDVRYGGVRAVNGLNITAEPGSIVGLIGPNGAGKTSAIDAITGYTAISTGRVLFDGVDVTDWKAHRRARAGLTRTFQQLELFTDLTVEENVICAASSSRRGDDESVERSIAMFDLGARRDALVSALPQGLRRMVAIARAVATKPFALLLDEPAAGLDNHESELLCERLRELAASGIAVVLVEHDMDLVMNACNHLVVIDFGTMIGTGTPEEVRADQRVIDAYLGIEKVETGA